MADSVLHPCRRPARVMRHAMSRAVAAVAATAAVGVLAEAALGRAEPRLSRTVDVFPAGTGAYPNYRVPSITAMPDGTLVAIAEGRTFDDPGVGNSDLDVVFRRSTDGGATWSAMQVLDAWAGGASSNPTTVLDRNTGRLSVLFNRWEGFLGTTTSLPGTTNNTAWVRHSDDGGLTWSAARDITGGVKDVANWNSVAFGPGSGIQASNGRLLIPAARWQNGWGGYAVFSADGGNTWSRGALAAGGNLSNENQLVQLADGRILMDARPNTGSPTGPRLQAFSGNNGVTFTAPVPGVSAPDSHAAIERLSLASATAFTQPNRILMTRPRGPDRVDLVVGTSYDEGLSYVNHRLLHDGYSGYSDITVLPDGSVGVLFETAEARSVSFLKFNRAWLEPPQRLSAFESFRYNAATLGTRDGGLLWSAGWAANADLTGAAPVRVRTSDLPFATLPFANEGGRSAFFDNGGTMARPLPSPISLAGGEPTYLSMLVRQEATGLPETEGPLEALDISLYAGTTKTVSFGVRGNEAFYFDLPGQGGQSAADAAAMDATYYLVAKIVPSASAGDQIYLRAFPSGDTVPATDDGMNWTLAGTAGVGSSAALDRLFIRGGTQADWLVDEIRVGRSFGAVVSNVLRYAWNVDASGVWGVGGNWYDGAPDGAGTTAEFGPTITAPRTVTVDAPRTVGHLRFDAAQPYRLEGTAPLTLDVNSGSASIRVDSGSHAIAAPLHMQDALRVTVGPADGVLRTSGPLSVDGTAAVVKDGAGRWEARHVRAGVLDLAGGTVAIIGGGGDEGTSVVRAITVVPGAAFDLNDAALVVDHAAGDPSALAMVGGLIAAGRAGGAWDGVGGINSSAAALEPGRLGIGFGPSSAWGVTTFGGQPVDDSAVLVRLTLLGDTNLDRLVGVSDFATLAARFNLVGAWHQGDFNFDGTTGIADFSLLASNFNHALAARGAAVPEAGGGPLLCVAVGLVKRRRRKELTGRTDLFKVVN